jgi:hypothetical protein
MQCKNFEDWAKGQCTGREALCSAINDFQPYTIGQLCRKHLRPEVFGKVDDSVVSSWSICYDPVVEGAVDAELAFVTGGGAQGCDTSYLDRAIAASCNWCSKESFVCNDHTADVGQRCVRSSGEGGSSQRPVFSDAAGCEHACGGSGWRALQWPNVDDVKSIQANIRGLSIDPVRKGVGCIDQANSSSGWQQMGASGGSFDVPCDDGGPIDIS